MLRWQAHSPDVDHSILVSIFNLKVMESLIRRLGLETWSVAWWSLIQQPSDSNVIPQNTEWGILDNLLKQVCSTVGSANAVYVSCSLTCGQ